MTDLILLPGLLNDERLWAHQAAHLAWQARVTVIRTDGGETIDDIVDAVLAAAPARFSLAGLSMGGYAAMALVRRAPGRVERLALVSTTARPDVPEQTEKRRSMIELAQKGGLDRVLPAILSSMVHPGHVNDPRVSGLFYDMARTVGLEGFVRQQNAIIRRSDSRAGLAAVACPAMVVVGEDDALTPPDRAEEAAGLIPNAKLVKIAQCGHLSAIEQPQAVTAALSLWLQM